MAQGLTRYLNGALGHAPIEDIQKDPSAGYIIHDDFINDTVSSSDWVMEKYITTIGTSATVTKGTTGFGTVILTSVTGEGAQLNGNEVWMPAPAAGQVVCFQARVKVNVLTAAYGTCFIGFQANKGNGTTTEDAPVDGADALTSNRDLVGVMIAATGAITGRSQNGTSAGTAVSMGTAVADTYVTVGFVIDENSKVTFFLDGVKKGSISSSTYIPDATLYFDATSFGGGSGGKIFTVDYYTIAVGIDRS